jgi:transporter family-2 protein
VSRALAIAMVALAGGFVGLQAPVNARLGRQLGSLQAASFSFLVGTIALLAVVALSSGGVSSLAHAGRAPWWALIGGLLGAFYVSVALITVRTLGASALTALVVGGQLAVAVAVDRFGLFGIAKQPLPASRVAGLVLLLAGVVLVVRK